MMSVRMRCGLALWAGFAGAGCAMGGQTYDDGSDEVRRNESEPEPMPEPTAEPGPGPDEEPEPSSEPEPAALSCEARSNDVAEQRQAFVESADRACDTVEDCVEVGTTPSCMDSCGSAIVVSSSAVASIEAAVADLDDTLCEDFFDAGCEFFPSGCPGSGPRLPACEAGECTMQEVNCEDLATEASAAVDAEIAALDLSCATDADCVVVITGGTCADTCDRAIVGNTTSLADGVEPLVAAACDAFTRAACDLPDADCPAIELGTESHCNAGQCVLGDGPPADCYGPEQNVDLAYEGTLPGCACGDVGDACVGPVALICEQGNWRAVEDGPCSPGLIDQGCDGRLASPQTCVELFDTCVDLGNGSFCGIGRRTSLCDDGEIVETQGNCYQDDAFCVELENGKYCTGSSPVDEP